MSASQRGRAAGARRRTAVEKNRTNRKPKQGAGSRTATDQPGVHSMTLRRTIRRTNILVGTTVAVIVFALSVTGVVLVYELGVDVQARSGDHRPSRGLDAEQLAALAGQGRHAAGETVPTLILRCRQHPCSSREQMLVMVAAHLDVPYWTLEDTLDGLGRGPAPAARR